MFNCLTVKNNINRNKCLNNYDIESSIYIKFELNQTILNYKKFIDSLKKINNFHLKNIENFERNEFFIIDIDLLYIKINGK